MSAPGMPEKVLVTGGAGFVGSHVVDELIEHGYGVRVLDALIPQVHGTNPKRPDYLHPRAELTVADVRDRDALQDALADTDAVIHLAAAVGVGQSMYQIEHYTSTNNLGTAILMQLLSDRPVPRLVIASSMSIYGEGAYRRADGATVELAQRSTEQLRAGRWEIEDHEGRPAEPLPTPETKPPDASSVYALSKHDQERLGLIVGQAYRIPTVALRLFNTYGPRQALSNPYTGVLAIFAARYLEGKPPVIFEDGQQQRDFVNVRDVARAFRLALEVPEADGEVFNIGSGRPITVRSVAEAVGRTLGREDLRPRVTAQHRAGDIRHCFADIEKARRILGYEPRVSFQRGLDELADWLKTQRPAPQDATDRATEELSTRGLVV
jgi:dTDP-L-rhamnose 4-epimerase